MSFGIYKYIFDPIEPELKYITHIDQNSFIKTAMTEEIILRFILPGNKKNEIIIITKEFNIWSCLIDSKSTLCSFRRLIYNLKLLNNEKDLEDIFYNTIPNNAFPYFINDRLIGLVIFIENECVFIFNRNEVQTDNIFIFSYDNEYISEDLGNLYINLFSIESGISVISTSEKIFRNEFPFNIKKFEQKEIPIDICVRNNCLFIFEPNQILKYPGFNKIKGKRTCKIEEKILLAWSDSLNSTENLLVEKNNQCLFKNAILTTTENDINLNDLTISNYSEIKLKLDKDILKITKLANKNLNIIYNKKTLLFWTNLSFFGKLKPNKSEILIKVYDFERYDALESLNIMQDSGFDLKSIAEIFDKALPQAFKSRIRTERKSYTKEEDLFILEHIYEDLTINQIAEKINHSRSSIYARFMNDYGTPSCDDHYQFEQSCIQCQESLKEWKEEVKQNILHKEYRIRKFADIELCELYSRKERLIRLQTLHLRTKISPEIYDNTIKFLAQIDCSGKSFKKLFLQCLRLILGKKIEEIGLTNVEPSNLVSIFCEIKPDFKYIRDLREHYKNIIGKEPYFFKNQELIYLTSINSISKVFDKSIVNLIKPLLIDILKNATNPKIGTIPAALYVFFRKQFTQNEIATIFNITEVTLRSEIKRITENPRLFKILENYEIQLNSIKFEPISRLKERETVNIKNSIENINKSLYSQDFDGISLFINSLEIKFLDENRTIILDIIKKLSKIQNKNIIHSLINFIIKYNCCNDEIFNNLIILISFDDKEVCNDILKLIYFYKPNLKGNNLYEILNSFSKEQNILILNYINRDRNRSLKYENIKEHIYKNFNKFKDS